MRLAAVIAACLLTAGLPAASLADQDVVGEDAGSLELSPVDSAVSSTPDADHPGGGESLVPGEEGATPPPSDPFASGGTGDAVTDDLDGPLAELRTTLTQLQAERATKQARLMQLEQRRDAAEQRLDAATDAIAAQLVALFERGESVRLQALVTARDELDPVRRGELTSALAGPELAVVREHDAATSAVSELATQADELRLQVLSLGTRIAALTAAVDERDAPTAAERARAAGARYSVDADLVFATGPIPGIGYWGDMAGGSVLDGWMGFAGAAVGGVGCEPPDPTLKATGQIEQGEASWYGPGFHGNGTANGETYDQTAMTAAHKTLPFGTIVRVYSSATARCAFVRINDRGPFIDGRIIDLSKAAADHIGMSGVAPVQVEVWAAPGAASGAS